MVDKELAQLIFESSINSENMPFPAKTCPTCFRQCLFFIAREDNLYLIDAWKLFKDWSKDWDHTEQNRSRNRFIESRLPLFDWPRYET